MSSIFFLHKMINDYWMSNDEKDKSSTNYWAKNIKDLVKDQLLELIEFTFKCHGIKLKREPLKTATDAINSGKDFEVSSDLIDVEFILNKNTIYSILDCIVASEFRIDSALYLPAEMRKKRVNEIAQSIGVEVGLLLKVDSEWRKTYK